MNLRKWFFHRRKEHPATTLHVFRTAEDWVDKERYNNNNNNKNKNEQAAGYEDADKPFFEDITGYNDIKKLIRMSINAYEPVHILLSGPPASTGAVSNIINEWSNAIGKYEADALRELAKFLKNANLSPAQ